MTETKKEYLSIDKLQTIIGKTYRLIIYWDSDYKEVAEGKTLEKYIRRMSYYENPILSCDIKLSEIKKDTRSYEELYDITAIVQRVHGGFMEEKEKPGNTIYLYPRYYQLFADGTFGDCQAEINDGGCLNCSGNYSVFCVPIELYNKYKVGKLEKYMFNKAMDYEIEKAEKIVNYLKTKYDVNVKITEILKFM